MATSFSEAVVKFTADSSAFKKQLAGIESAVGEAASRMASEMKTAILGVSAAIAAGTGTLAVLVKLSADAGDSLAKLSQRVGVSVETLSGYKLAAELAGISLEDLGTALQRTSKNILEAAGGTGTAKDAFAALGISVTDQAGKLKNADEIMLEVADRFSKMEDGAQKTALAMEIFGKSGAALIPLMNQGSAAIMAQTKEAKELGITWTGAQAKLAEAMNDALARLSMSFAGIRNTLATYFFPFVTAAVDSLLAKIKEWTGSGDIKLWASRIAEWTLEAIAKIVDGFGWVIGQLPRVVDGFKWVTAEVTQFGADVARIFSQILQAISSTLLALEKVPLVGSRMKEGLEAGRGAIGAATKELDGMAESAEGASEAIRQGMGKTPAWIQTLVQGTEDLSGKIREWGAKAMHEGTEALAGGAAAAVKKTTEEVASVIEYEVNGIKQAMTVWSRPTTWAPPLPGAVGAGTAGLGGEGGTIGGPLSAAAPGGGMSPGLDLDLLRWLANTPGEEGTYEYLKHAYARQTAEATLGMPLGSGEGFGLEGVGDTIQPGLENVKTSFDEAMGYMEKRSKDAFSTISQNMHNGLEEWFVEKLRDQAARS